MTSQQHQDGFARITNEIFEKTAAAKLSGTEYAILLIVWRYSYGFNRGNCSLSLSFFEKATGMSRKGICNSINNLIERNILTVLQKPSFNTPRKLMYQKDHTKWKGMPQKDDNIDTKENEYLAATESEYHSTVESEYSSTVEAECHSTVEAECHSTVEAECHSTVEAEYHQERKNKENIKKYMSRSDLNEPFERFRKAYPKRQAKQDAMKAFIKLDPDETLLTVMIEAVTRHKASEGWQKNGGQYFPLAATRLNGKRREDEITETEADILKPKRILPNENDL